MLEKYLRLYATSFITVLCMCCTVFHNQAWAQTTTFTQGVADNGTSLAISFTSTPASTSVILSYILNGGGRQNVNMTNSGGTFDYTITPVTAGAAESLSYYFTYVVSGTQYGPTATYTWSRTSSPSYSLSATATSVKAGGTGTSTVTESVSNGFDSAVTLAASGMPSGVTAAFSPASITGAGTSTLILTAASTTTAGSYTITVTGRPASGGAETASFTLTVSGATSSSYSLSATAASVKAGGTGTSTVTESVSNGFDSAVTLAASGMPSGVTAAFSPASIAGAGTSTLTLTAASTATAGSYTITVTGTPASGSTETATFALTVSASTGASFTQGVIQEGSEAIVYFAPAWTPSPTMEVIYQTTSSTGVVGTQQGVNMTYNATAQQWQTLVEPISAGEKISYYFNYTPAAGGGNILAPTTAPGTPYMYTVCGGTIACASTVATPTFSPAQGVYTTSQTVTLSDATAGAVIYYTTNMTYPTTSSTQYTGPISVTGAEMINAIAVLNGQQSMDGSSTYDIQAPCPSEGCNVAAPAFSIPSGTYNTQIMLNLLTSTTGALVYYTLDGSNPTTSSTRLQFNGSILLQNTTAQSTWTVNAYATLNGVNSSVVTSTYKITANTPTAWNGSTTFKVVNNTGYPNTEVYWFMIGMDWATGDFVTINSNGTEHFLSTADNTIPVPAMGASYADYALTVAEASSVTIQPLESARIYFSVGSPILISVNTTNTGTIGYAGPAIANPNDPSQTIEFDMAEFDINPTTPVNGATTANPGIWVDTSRVDDFGIPIQLNVVGQDGFNETTGESLAETRAQIMARYFVGVPSLGEAGMPSAFQSLAQFPYIPYRIVAPANGTFNNQINTATGATTGLTPGANSTYLDSYTAQVWQQYESSSITLDLAGIPATTCSVLGGNFNCNPGDYVISGQPTTTEVLLGDGNLAQGSGEQLQVQAQMCAALNRHVANLPFSDWWNPADFYPAGEPANSYAQFWHQHALNGLAYGFAYDDVGGQSSTIYTYSPTTVTFTLGK
jgi:hypothetical protein